MVELPAGSPTTLLNGLQYPDLRIFSTNLPHRGLISFLIAHPLLGSVILGSCGRSEACPLRGVELRSLTGLQCPSRCFAGIVQRSLVTATVALSRLNSMSTLAIQTITSRLHSLTIDYFTNDYDILARIAATLPHIRKLKLNEKRYPEVCVFTAVLVPLLNYHTSAVAGNFAGLGMIAGRGTMHCSDLPPSKSLCCAHSQAFRDQAVAPSVALSPRGPTAWDSAPSCILVSFTSPSSSTTPRPREAIRSSVSATGSNGIRLRGVWFLPLLFVLVSRLASRRYIILMFAIRPVSCPVVYHAWFMSDIRDMLTFMLL